MIHATTEKKQHWAEGTLPDSNVHGANIGPIWVRQDPGGPHVGPMRFAIWAAKSFTTGKIMAVGISFKKLLCPK